MGFVQTSFRRSYAPRHFQEVLRSQFVGIRVTRRELQQGMAKKLATVDVHTIESLDDSSVVKVSDFYMVAGEVKKGELLRKKYDKTRL
jgi:hypothetical protein